MSVSPTSLNVGAGQQGTVEVIVDGSQLGTEDRVQGQVVLTTNDPDQQTINIAVEAFRGVQSGGGFSVFPVSAIQFANTGIGVAREAAIRELLRPGGPSQHKFSHGPQNKPGP